MEAARIIHQPVDPLSYGHAANDRVVDAGLVGVGSVIMATPGPFGHGDLRCTQSVDGLASRNLNSIMRHGAHHFFPVHPRAAS